jgi:hypothetical protein
VAARHDRRRHRAHHNPRERQPRTKSLDEKYKSANQLSVHAYQTDISHSISVAGPFLSKVRVTPNATRLLTATDDLNTQTEKDDRWDLDGRLYQLKSFRLKNRRLKNLWASILIVNCFKLSQMETSSGCKL